MISPYGTFLARSHELLASVMEWLLGYVVDMTALPAVFFFAIVAVAGAVRVANDPRAAQDYVSEVIRAFGLMVVCLSLDLMTRYVHGGIFVALPSWIATGLAPMVQELGVGNGGINSAGGTAAPLAQGGGPVALGASLNALHALAWGIIATAEAQVPMGDMFAGFAADLAGYGCSGLIAVMTYMAGLSEWTLCVLVGGAPVVFAVSQWRPLKDVVWRWAGVVLSVLLVLFFGMIVLVVAISLLTHLFQEFAQRQAEAQANIDALPLFALQRRLQAVAAAVMQNTQMLVEMTASLFMAVLTLIAVPTLAYSIGGGIMGNHTVALAGAALAARNLIAAGISRLSGLGGAGGSGGGGHRSPNYALQMPPKPPPQLGQSGHRIGAPPTHALPPPPRPPVPRP